MTSLIRQRLDAATIRIAAFITRKQLLACDLQPRSLSGLHAEILPIRYNYRADDHGCVSLTILKGGVHASYKLYSMRFSDTKPVPDKLSLECSLSTLQANDRITVNLEAASVFVNDRQIAPAFSHIIDARKFISEIQLTADNRRYSRLCCHYRTFEAKEIRRDYYFGDDYADYLSQASPNRGVTLVKPYRASGRLLDVGCALGLYTKSFLDAGYDSHGIDVSAFAVNEAAKLLGKDRVFCANLETHDIPWPGSFDIVWMWDVLEHFCDPLRVLATVTRRSHTGTLLFIHTSNSQALTHRVFGRDWEGYTDYSHRGVDLVSADSLRQWLHQLGWQLVEWECNNIWVEGTDPVVMQLKNVFNRSYELQVFLQEYNLGDAIRVVARKR